MLPESESRKVKHLVVDSGAFIKNAPLKDIGEEIYTISDVVYEIRDRVTRERLQVLPYTLRFREPTPEIIKHVTNFSKKTGDFHCLSAVDIRVIALTYMLEKENVGESHLRPEPKPQQTVSGRPQEDYEELRKIAGFYVPKKQKVNDESDSVTGQATDSLADQLAEIELTSEEKVNALLNDVEDCAGGGDVLPDDVKAEGHEVDNLAKNPDVTEEESSSDPANCDEGTTDDVLDEREDLTENQKEPVLEDDDYDEVNEDDILRPVSDESDTDEGIADSEESDEEGRDAWITPQNVAEAKRQMEVLRQEQDSPPVACITTDFAMQNVMIQMGLKVLSVDGMLIKHAKTYILRCYGCFKTTTNMAKIFCPNCGNKTLKRVAYILNEDGSRQVFINFKRPINTKGLNRSLPAPRGGKYSNDPIVCEDQRLPQHKTSTLARNAKKVDVFDPDYVAGPSPFAINDVYSRSAHLGFRGPQHLSRRPVYDSIGTKKKGKKRK